MPKITKQQAQEIIDKYVSGVSSDELAIEYGLWQTSICNLIRGDSWPECQRPENIIQIINSKHTGNKYKELPELNQIQKDILIGSLLGDGTFTKPHSSQNRGNSKFSKTQRNDRKNYLDWHFEKMEGYSATLSPVYSYEKLSKTIDGKIQRNKAPKYLSGYCFSTFNHPNLTEFRNKWYPEGVKQVPYNLELNPQRIAIWYFDDGSNNEKQRYAVICTQGFTFKEAEFLVEKFKPFDLQPSITKTESKYDGRSMPQLKFSRSSYDKLINLIKPYMLWDCFNHKIKHHDSKTDWNRLTKEQAEQVLFLKNTMSIKEMAEKFNVIPRSIYRIISGESWNHLQR